MSHQDARSSTPSSSSTRSSSNTSYGFGSSTHSSYTSATGGSACHGGPGSDKSLYYDSPTSVGQRVFRPINSPIASSSASSWGPSDNAPTMASYESYHGYMPSTPASSTLGGGSSWSSPTLVQPSPSYSGYQDLSPYVLSPVPSNASGIQLNPCLQTGNVFMLDFLRYEQDAHRLVNGGDPAFMPGMANAEIRFMQFKSGTCHVQARNQAYITVQDVLDSVYRFLQQNDQSPHHAPQGNFRPGTPTARSGGRPSTPTPTGHYDRRVRRIDLIASLGMTRYGGMVRAHGPNTWILHFVQ
ncbi:hypothetical protein CPC08DRAFT_762965 [Agrocybe pediades]|nr:hypothetical protein CPC08DRAFT_762965 [Agrocybe pediades]